MKAPMCSDLPFQTGLVYGSIRQAQPALLQYEDNAVYRITTRIGEHFVLRVSAAEGHVAAVQRV